jgi:hypothetical protein
MVYIIIQVNKMERLHGEWNNMRRVLTIKNDDLLEFEKIVQANVSVEFIVKLTVDIFYQRCVDHKVNVVDWRGMSHSFTLRCHLYNGQQPLLCTFVHKNRIAFCQCCRRHVC